MCDVGEGAAVDKGGVVLEGLDEVGRDGVLEQGRHGTLSLEVMGRDGLAVVGVGDHDAAQALLEVHEVGREAEDGHDLGGHGDVETVLARHAVGDAAEAVDDLAQLAVVHVHRTLPYDAARVDAQLVALLDVVVEHGREQVVGVLDGVEVAREVQVDVFHRDDLGIAAAGRTALDAEDRAEGRLAQGQHRLFAQQVHRVGKTHGRGRLALARRGRVDGGHEDELGLLGTVGQLGHVDLGHVVAVRDELVIGQAELVGDLLDGFDLSFLRDLDIGLCHVELPLCSHVVPWLRREDKLRHRT